MRFAAKMGVMVFGSVVLAAGCSGDGDGEGDTGATHSCHDLGGDPAFTEFTVTPGTVAAGGEVDVTVDGDHIGELMDMAHGTMEGTEHDHEEEGCLGGHLHVYIDDFEENPLAMEGAKAFPMTIPADTTPGTHTLIVRLHNKDHTIHKPEVTMETTVTVE